MKRHSKFVAALCAVAGAGLLSACTQGAASTSDDGSGSQRLFFGGPIYTANADQETVEALLVEGDTVRYAGSLAQAREIAGDGAEQVDLDGSMILPGLHDTHLHPLLALEKPTCRLPKQNEFDLAKVITEVKGCLADLGDAAPAAGEWITVSQFNGYGADSKNYLGKYPDIATGLDEVTTEHNLILMGADGHAYAVNHYALENGATIKKTDPVEVNSETLTDELKEYKGLIPVNADGEPNGQLRSQAAWDLFDYDITTAEQFLQDPDTINEYFLSNGITSAMEAWAHQRDVDVYGGMAADGNLTPRISLSMVVQKDVHSDGEGGADIDKVMADVDAARERAEGSDKLKVDSVKLMVDGVMEYPTQTAALDQPYLDVDIAKDGTTEYHSPTEEKLNRGLLELPPGEVERLVAAIDAKGYSAHFHTIGNRAVDIALTAIEKARAANPGSDAPHNIAHLQLVRPQDIERFGSAGVFASPTTAWAAPWHSYDTSVMPYIDKYRNVNDLDEFYAQDTKYMQQLYPVESIRKAGGTISIGSDAPVDFKGPRPFTNMMYALLRGEWIADPDLPKNKVKDNDYTWVVLNKKERMSIRDIIDAYTINGAKALQQDDITGSLEEGKKADFVIINNDIISMAETVKTKPNGTESVDKAYSICDKVYDDEYCSTEVESTWIDGEQVYGKE